MEDIMLSILRTSVSFSILMVVSLWIGKQINSAKNHFNFALSITIGSFIANMGFDIALKFTPMLASFLSLIVIYFFISLLTMNSRILRRWLSGQPTVVVENGKLLDENMRKIRLSVDDLNQQLRELGIFDMYEVEYALMEVSGKLSVLKKTSYQGVTKKDLHPNTPNQEIRFPRELILDGKIIEKNFNANYSRKWLHQELAVKSLKIEDVQYAVISTKGSLVIDLFEDHLHSPIEKE